MIKSNGKQLVLIPVYYIKKFYGIAIYFFVFSSIRKASVGSSWCHGLYPVSRLVLYYILPVVCHITLPFPSTRRKKHQHINKNQTFSTIYSRSFVLGKEKFQRKRLLPACIAGVWAGCANVFSLTMFLFYCSSTAV